ncbi:MAG: superoxide dismutase family protein [Saprospiraceae bacterium]|nr:superoxide dismutase family protein [Saprospiraceae bacterium]
MISISKLLRTTFFSGLIMAGLLSCSGSKQVVKSDNKSQDMHKTHMGNMMDVNKAVCVLYPTAGHNVSGTVVFTKQPEGVKVNIDIKGLKPGKHGFHIHEFGDCSASDGTSAGGHFNPGSKDHGGPMDSMRHAGDMGNIDANSDGKVITEYFDKSIMLSGPGSIIGHSIIVHDNEDDLKTQPTGNAGPRAACGTIGVAKNQ